MYATPHRNVFGITTHYGTHPDPPRRFQAKKVLRATATWVVAAVIAVRGLRR